MMYSPSQTYNRRGYYLAAGVVGAVLIAVFLPPFLSETAAGLIRGAFSTLCHQLPDRTMMIGGQTLAVCHRCVGIYAGIVAAAILFPLLVRWNEELVRFAGPIILIALLVPGVDWLGEVVGLWHNSPASRTITGFVFGFPAGYYFTLGVCGVTAPRSTAATSPSA